jgi:prevent-host-death family protein
VETVGVRELKAHLSRYLGRVRGGARLLVTDRGRAIAALAPVEAPVDVAWAHDLVASGGARWGGGKPAGSPRPVPVGPGRTVSEVVIEERR